MTKNGSNARKARIREHARRTGTSYRKAAAELDQVEKARAEGRAALRAAIHDPENLAEERDVYLADMLAASLPDTVKVCLYVLSARMGTGRLTDPRAVRCAMTDLAAETGLDIEAACLSVHLAEAHGWMTAFHDEEARLTIPGEYIHMYEHFLRRETKPIRNLKLYQSHLDDITAHVAQHAAEKAAFLEKVGPKLQEFFSTLDRQDSIRESEPEPSS